MGKIKRLIKLLGPGLMWAGAAVGVSHLVQSTRAGAEFGFALIGLLIFSNIIKYPFFEFAPRYAAATGQHLVQGYKNVGKWAVALYGVLTVLTMFTIQAAVTIVTASLVGNIFGLSYSLVVISAGLLLITMLIIAIGRYSLIDGVMKVIILTLTISTLIAVASALNIGYHPIPDFEVSFDWSNPMHLAFLIAFVGWMPAPIDISVWHSFWSYAKQKETGQRITLKDALLDFNIGYIGTAILAAGFLTLGAILMYGSGESFSPKGTVFAGQLIEFGQTRRGWLGVYIQEVTTDIAESLGLDDDTGALISSVNESGPAAKGGIQPGDVIVKFDGKTWTNYTKTDGLGNEGAQSIAISPDNTVWCGAFGEGVSRFDGETWRNYTPLNSDLAGFFVLSIVVDSEGNVVGIITRSGVIRIIANSKEITNEVSKD